MASKTCPECGASLALTDTFCPNCGFDLTAVHAIGASNDLKRKFNLNVKMPGIIATSLKEDLQVQQIADYKRSMGFPDRVDNIVFAQNYNPKQSLTLIWDLLTAKSYILSFEKHGILFIGLGAAGQFTGKNAYLADDEIREFDFRYGFGKRVLTIRSTRGTIKLMCPLTIKWKSFQKQNLARLGQLTDQYNRWVDEQN
ncbi:zinc-ribbon domain-containing protein [Lactobacillaceae bacterium Melli_B4]